MQSNPGVHLGSKIGNRYGTINRYKGTICTQLESLLKGVHKPDKIFVKWKSDGKSAKFGLSQLN